MNVTYDYYRIFYYVGKYGSFTKAAEMLDNSQPNITRAMNLLESQLGVVLFIRSKKGTLLTEEGRRLFDSVSLAFEQISAAEREIENSKNLETGKITIGASEIALHEILLELITDFRSRYPKISIQITNESTPNAIRSLKEGVIDFALVTSPVPFEEQLKYVDIKDFTEYAVIRKNFEKRVPKAIKLKDIEKYPIISLPKGSGTRKYYDDIFAAHKLKKEPEIVVATSDQVLPMVKAGLGIGFVPECMLKGHDEDVVKIEIKEQLPKRKICLVYDKSRSLGIAARTLLAGIDIVKP